MLNKFRYFAFIAGLLISKIVAADDVTVYVWQQQGANVGHVSLSTTRSYISLWPQDGFVPSQGQLHAHAVSLLNYDADKTAEGGEAHNKYYLKLDVGAIDKFWQKLLENSTELSNGRKKLSGVTWFAPSGADIASPCTNHLNLNCASTVILALGFGGLNINSFLRQIFQQPSRTSSDVRDVFQQAAGDQSQPATFMAMADLAFTYLRTIKPKDVSNFVQQHIYEQIGAKIETLILEKRKLCLKLDGKQITKQDAIKYFVGQLSELPTEERNKVRSTSWICAKYLPQFGTMQSAAEEPHESIFTLHANTEREIASKVERRQQIIGGFLGGSIVGVLAYWLLPEEDRSVGIPAGVAVGGAIGYAAAAGK